MRKNKVRQDVIGYAKDNLTFSDADTSISQERVALMQKTAKAADVDYKNVDMIHGKANYVLGLKALYMYANKVRGLGKTTTEAMYNSKKEEVLNYFVSSVTGDTKDKLENLLNGTRDMLVNERNDHNTINGAAKYFEVLGFAMHLLGDTYAHRSIVPAYTIKNVKENRVIPEGGNNNPLTDTSRFGTNDFLSGTSTEDESVLLAWAKNPKDLAKNINRSWACVKRTILNGYMEFRDIQYYLAAYNPNLSEDQEQNPIIHRYYEDNPNFCHSRFANTKILSRNLLQFSYLKEEFSYYAFFWPVQYGVLNGFERYISAARENKKLSRDFNGNMVSISDSDWSEVSRDY